jgi:hypothetical protein
MGFTHQILEAMDVQVISNSDEKMDIFMDKILRTVRTGVTAVSDSRSQQEKPRQQVEDQTYEANFRHKHAARNLTEDDTSGDACDIQSYFKKRLASLQSVAKGNTSVKTGMNSILILKHLLATHLVIRLIQIIVIITTHLITIATNN